MATAPLTIKVCAQVLMHTKLCWAVRHYHVAHGYSAFACAMGVCVMADVRLCIFLPQAITVTR